MASPKACMIWLAGWPKNKSSDTCKRYSRVIMALLLYAFCLLPLATANTYEYV